MTLCLAWKKYLGGIVWLVCVCAAASCGELRLPAISDAGPVPPPADAAPRADATPAGDGGLAIDAGPNLDGGPSIDAGLGCADVDIGSALGAAVFSGNTTGLPDDDLSPGCGDDSPPAGDIYMAWTAPATDRFLFDTCGSMFDTVLSAREGNCGRELECSDDVEVEPCEFQSRFSLDLLQGQRIILVVDGYGEEGEYVLNITQL